MNYVLISLIVAAPGYVLAAVLAFVLRSQGRDREVVEANLRTQCDDVLLRNGKLKGENDALRKRVEIMIDSLNVAQAEVERLLKDNEQYSEAVVDLNEEIKALMARNTGLSDALEKTRVLYNSILAQNKALQAKRTTKKAVSE